MDVRKTEVDFFNCNFEPGPPFWDRWHEVVVKNGAKMHPFEPQFSLQGAFHGKSDFRFVQMGHVKQLMKPIL